MICLDASVAVKLILEEDWSVQADALYLAIIQRGESIIAPPLLPIEVTNTLRQRMRASDGLSLQRATALLADFENFSIEIYNPAWLHRQALILADAFGLPAAYDAHYLALAEHFECELWTADRRLLRAVGSGPPFVRPIAEYNATA